MTFISVTRLRLRSWYYLAPFFWHSSLSVRQAKSAPENLQVATQRKGRDFWTLTVWENEAAMKAFMRSGAHREAMPMLAKLSESASTVHWQQESNELPTWREAELILWEKGRHIKFDERSQFHTARGV